MASTRSRHIRKLKQAVKHFDTIQIYFSEIGATYEKRSPKISEACVVAYQLIDSLKLHTQRIMQEM